MIDEEKPEPSLRTILEKLDTIDSRVAPIAGVGGKVDVLGTKVEALDAKFDDLRLRVDSQNLVLDDMRSQNRVTIEAVEAARLALDRRIDRLDQETRSRDALLELALRDLKVSVKQNSIDIRDLGARAVALTRLEERVAAIERRLA